MKRIGCYGNSTSFHQGEYYTIAETNTKGIPTLSCDLPSRFVNSPSKHLTVLNFEAFYSDPNNASNLFRSDCTECHSNIGQSSNYKNEMICLSGRGFCGYLYYDLSSSRIQDLQFKFGNPLFPNVKPIYVVIQLLLEIF